MENRFAIHHDGFTVEYIRNGANYEIKGRIETSRHVPAKESPKNNVR